jgi:hypothetical protein
MGEGTMRYSRKEARQYILSSRYGRKVWAMSGRTTRRHLVRYVRVSLDGQSALWGGIFTTQDEK